MNVRSCAPLIGALLVAGVSVPAGAQIQPKLALQKPPALSTYESLKPQLSAGARCKLDALESGLKTKLKTAGAGTTKESLLQSMGVEASDASEQAALVALMEAASEQNVDLDLQETTAEAKEQAAQELALQQLMADTAKSEGVSSGAMNAATLEASTQKLPPGPCVVASVAKPAPDPKFALFLAKRQSIEANLSPGVLAKVLAIAHSPQAKPGPNGGTQALLSSLHAQFPNSSTAQLSMLSIVAEQEALAQMQAAMNQMTQQQIQAQQSEYAQLEEAISSMMQAMASTQDSIVQNMKG